MTVVVIDYGICNVDSVRRALEECGASVEVTSEASPLRRADHIVLPGVGSFRTGMRNLEERGLVDPLRVEAAAGAPILGICLGMQLLASHGTEAGGAEGLGLVPGVVERLKPTDHERRVPHMGWNEVEPALGARLFAGVSPGTDFYFVHSYHVRCQDPAHEAATTPYVGGFTSAVQHGEIFGVQFHPEKSQQSGFVVLRNFLAV